MESKMISGVKCPKCGERHIEEFMDAYWLLCHDCGYNSPVYPDEDEAISAFKRGVMRRDIDTEKEE